MSIKDEGHMVEGLPHSCSPAVGIEVSRIRETQNTAAIVLHTTGSDWSKQQIAGIRPL